MSKFLKKYGPYIFLALVILVFGYFGYAYFHKYMYMFKSPQKIKEFILSYGSYGFCVFILLQVLQVVVFFIPGEVVQIASGFLYGTWIGALLSLIGIVIGSSITFFVARILGKPFVDKIVSKDKIEFLDKYINSGKAKYAIFVVYLIPGLPKDVLGYVVGTSDMSFKEFFIYSGLGRVPGIFISSYFGYKMYTKDIWQAVVVAVVMTILFVIGVFKGQTILNKIFKK